MLPFEQLSALVQKNRSYRRFLESESIAKEQLLRWIDLSRYTASGRNQQPLKYKVSIDVTLNVKIFEHLAWAGYLADWNGPEEGERPAAYIFVLKDARLGSNIFCDDGISIQTILLAAVSEGFGGCIIGSFNRAKISHLLKLPDYLELLWIVALGKPVETVVIETVKDGNIKYWRDKDSVHHVPKRSLTEIIVD